MVLLPSRIICRALFTEESPGHFMCYSCSRVYRSVNGWTNLMTHLHRSHPDFQAAAEAALRERNALGVRLVEPETIEKFRWCEWTVVDQLPFTFCERHLVRQNVKMKPISKKTLKIHLQRIQVRVEAEVQHRLPTKFFGLVLDGWTCGSRHFVAIFAVYDDGTPARPPSSRPQEYFEDLDCHSSRYLLLAFSPVENEDDLSAQSLFDLIADTLSRYEKPWESVLFIVGDNCSVNQYIGRRDVVTGILFIGCARHRFNLVIKDFLSDYSDVLDRVHALMKRLNTIKGRAILRTVSPLAPCPRNDTRWSSVYAMVERYCALEQALRSIDHGTVEEHGLNDVFLSRREAEQVRALRVDLERMESVTQALQRSTLTLSGTRRLFDRVVEAFPRLQTRLAAEAAIVNNAPLESGIVKIQRAEALNASERTACSGFKLDDGETEARAEEERPSFVRDAFKRRRTVRRQRYMELGFIPPTSNECERFFSPAKHVLTDERKCMDTTTLEMLMILKYNRDLWDVYTVEAIRREVESNERE